MDIRSHKKSADINKISKQKIREKIPGSRSGIEKWKDERSISDLS